MKNIIEVKEINLKEIDEAAFTLVFAFKHDPLLQWIFVNPKHYEEKAFTAIRTWIKYCVLYGKALRTNNFEAVALRRTPRNMKLTFWRLFRSGMFRLPQILGKESFARLMQLDELITKEQKNLMQQQSFLYCWMLGVKPEYQRQGFGGALMQYTFDVARKNNLPCYLETASESAKKIHMMKGFETLSEINIPNSQIILNCMLNKLVE